MEKPPLGWDQRRLYALLPAGMSHRGWSNRTGRRL